MAPGKTTRKRLERKRRSPPQLQATRVSTRQAARKATKSIHEDSPVGRAANRDRRKETPKDVTVTTQTKRGKTVTTIATNTAPSKQPPAAVVAAAAPATLKTPPAAVSTTTTITEKPKAKVPNRQGNKNYLPEEDLWLCKAYIYCTQDNVKGIEQTSTVFWSKVLEQFEIQRNAQRTPASGQKFVYPNRDALSLRNRWQKKILREVNKFVAIYHAIESSPPSGVPEHEWADLAAKSFFRQENRPFQYMNCWEYLKDKEKFKVPQEVVLDEGSTCPDESVAGVSGLGFSSVSSKKKRGGKINHVIAYRGSVRPMGRDMAKKLAKEEQKMERENARSSITLKSTMDDMISTLKDKQKILETHNKEKELQAKKEFQFNSYMKMAEFYTKTNNKAKANEFMEKAQGLLAAEEEDDRKPSAVEGRKLSAEESEQEEKEEASVNSLLEYSQRKAAEYEESQLERECMEAMRGSDSDSTYDDSFNTAKGQIPATELQQKEIYKLNREDRRMGIEWIHWIPPFEEEMAPFYSTGPMSPKSVDTWSDHSSHDREQDNDDQSTTSKKSEALLSD